MKPREPESGEGNRQRNNQNGNAAKSDEVVSPFSPPSIFSRSCATLHRGVISILRCAAPIMVILENQRLVGRGDIGGPRWFRRWDQN
jgi:hypothetical protein